MSADRPVSSGPRVLVADDDPTIVLLLEHALQGMGRSYDTADDGDEAWTAWERERHELVVLDIEMPKLDGLEVCRRIRAADTGRKTFVLIVTGRDKAVDLEAALSAGADDYVTKPVTGPRIIARLRIAQRRMADDDARRKAEDELGRAKYMAGIGETSIALQHATIVAAKSETDLELKFPADAAPVTLSLTGSAQIFGHDLTVPVSTGPAFKKLFPRLLVSPPAVDGLIAASYVSRASRP